MRRKSLVIALALGTALLLGGCNQSKGGGVLVVDLDAVAKAIGADKAIDSKVTAHNQELAQQLDKIREELKKTLAEDQTKLGTTPTNEQKQAFQQKFQAAQQAFGERNQQAQQESNQFRLKQAQEFRDQVKPVAEELAKKKGATVVSTPVTLLWTDPGSDITQDVIKVLNERGGKAATPSPAGKPAGG